MNDFQFLRPFALLLLIPFFALLFWASRSAGRSSIWRGICTKELLPYILEKKGKRRWFPYALTLLTGSLLIGALAGPSWGSVQRPLVKSHSALVIALDLSKAMDAEDIKPSRLQRAIFKITDLLKGRLEGQTALVVFSGDSFVVTPLTDDTAAIQALLPALDTTIMPSSGHRADKAIALAAELFKQAGESMGKILLMTSSLSKQEMEKSIALAKQEGLSISVLGLGTEEGAPIPKQEGGFIKDEKGSLVVSTLSKENLLQLAEGAGGSFAILSVDESDLAKISPSLAPMGHSTSSTQERDLQTAKTQGHDEGYLLVVLALPFALLFFRKGLLTAGALFLMPHLPAASTDFWQTRDQLAEQLFKQGEYKQAKELFQNPDWKAAASYQLGEYEEAANGWQLNESPDGLYNYGTAIAKIGDFDAAIESFDKVLKIEPHHEDALHNKKVIEEWKKQQQEQEQKQQEESQQDQKQKPQQQKDQQNQQEQKGSQNKGESDSASQEEKQNEGDSQDGENGEKETNENSSAKSSGEGEETKEKDEKKGEELKEQYQAEMDQKIAENEKKEREREEFSEQGLNSPQDSQLQADERWLQRVKDDPGGLLRRKFLLKYQQQNRRRP